MHFSSVLHFCLHCSSFSTNSTTSKRLPLLRGHLWGAVLKAGKHIIVVTVIANSTYICRNPYILIEISQFFLFQNLKSYQLQNWYSELLWKGKLFYPNKSYLSNLNSTLIQDATKIPMLNKYSVRFVYQTSESWQYIGK